MSHARYLGDGVYASWGEYNEIALTTGHHLPAEANNVIYMEPQVAEAFQQWLIRLRESLKAGEKPERI